MAADGRREQTIQSDIVVTKYKMAGDMINKILLEVVEQCRPGASVLEICEFGDNRVLEETSKVFKKEKDMKKGIAFPTCVSVNNCVCHYAPLRNDPDTLLNDGDLVKVDMGCHIDGFIAVVAHTFCLGFSRDFKVTGRKADTVLAAHYALESALRLLTPTTENYRVTDIIQKAAAQFHCKPIEDMMSHQLKQNRIDADKAIIQNPSEESHREHDRCEFETHEVYALDILVSSGEGKVKTKDTRTTVYKKTDEMYQLKMKASRAFFSDVEKKFNTMPFTLRMFEDERKARMGVIECERHKLLEPFQVLYEKDGEFVAQFKCTVLLMPNGPLRITAGPFDLQCFHSDLRIESIELKALIAQSLSKKAVKKKKKKAERQASAAAAAVKV